MSTGSKLVGYARCSTDEAIRCLKRYIAREIYHDITSTRAAPTARSAA